MKNLLSLLIASLFVWQVPLVFGQHDLPVTVDWRDSLESTRRVDNQRICGSCYAFSALESLEGAYGVQGKKVDLSEQQIIDCADGGYGNFGCQGGWPHLVFDYIQEKGISSEKAYHYRGVQLDSCLARKHLCKPIVSHITLKNEDDIKRAVAEMGPVSVVIKVQPTFYTYSGGIYDDPSCTPGTDHAVTVIGYGTENGKDYWLIKNSWGNVWGEQGYMKIVRGKNMCGIGNIGNIPILKCRSCVPSCKKGKDEH